MLGTIAGPALATFAATAHAAVSPDVLALTPSPQFEKIRALVEPVANHMGTYALTKWNAIESVPLEKGPEIFGKMAELIKTAEKEVMFQTWRWDNDGAPAKEILSGIEKLEARRQQTNPEGPPVVVRLLINSIAVSPRNQMAELAKKIELMKLDPKLVDVRLAEFNTVQAGANHSKTLVVDSKVAVMTGANASNDNMGTPTIYTDVGFVMRGEVARALHNDFAEAWSDGELWKCGSTPEPLFGGGFWMNSNCREHPDPISRIEVRLPPDQRAGLSQIPIMVAGHKDRIPLVFGAKKYDNPQNQAFVGMFAFAEKRIRIQTPNLNDPMARRAIVAAIKSGIDVQLLLSKKYEQLTESMPGRGGSNDDTVDWLHSILHEVPTAKRCGLLQIRWFSNDGVKAVEENGPPSSHVKYMSIDGKIAMIGSANQDVQSWQNSRELNLVIDSEALTRSYDEKIFEAAWDKAIPVDRCLPAR